MRLFESRGLTKPWGWLLVLLLSAVLFSENVRAINPEESNDQATATNCSYAESNKAIIVGANKDVGSQANLKEKAKGKATGLASKALSNVLGVGIGGRKSKGPKTKKDPIKSKNKTKAEAQTGEGEIRSGAKFTDDGLLISTDILKAKGKGTFQTVYLENQRGWRMMPIALYMYKIWQDWKLTVSWTRDTYVDGQHVKHEEGGWSESWRVLVSEGQEIIDGPVQQAPIWQQLGFNIAVSGARSLGTLFPVSPEMLAVEPIKLVIHITNPKNDPVDTTPYILKLSLDDNERIVVDQLDQDNDDLSVDCDDPKPIPNVDNDNKANDIVTGVSTGKDSAIDYSIINAKNPCTTKCKKLLQIATDKEGIAKNLQNVADKAKQEANTADQAAKDAEDKAKKAEELAKDDRRDDKAIVDGEEYTTADTEYRIILQGEINAAHKAGQITNKEHEAQTKANTVKNARDKRLKKLASLKKAAKKARAKADAARKEADKAKTVAQSAQKKADDALAEAKTARQAYDDCIKKAKEECEKQKAAEAKRIAAEQAAEEKRQAELAQAEAERLAAEKRKLNEERNRQLRINEDKRLLELIKKLGLIDKKISDVPSLWGWLPDVIETPVGMLAESGAIPIPTDVLKGLGGLYGIIGSMKNPCTKAGIETTESRLQEMINEKTGKKYTEAEASKETAKMCRLLNDVRGRLAALQNARK